MRMATACLSVHLVVCRNAGAAVSIICLREATVEHISTGNRGFAWWSDGACAPTARGLVTETWVLSTWSAQRCFDRHRSETSSPYHGITDAMSKTTACRGCEEEESKVDPPSDRQDAVERKHWERSQEFKKPEQLLHSGKIVCWQPSEAKQKVDGTSTGCYWDTDSQQESGQRQLRVMVVEFLQ